MLRVTVMMFKDIVESVTLLKEDAWNVNPQIMSTNLEASPSLNLTIITTKIQDRVVGTRSKRGGRCFLRRRWRFSSLEAVLCSVALLNLQIKASMKLKWLK